MDRGAWEATVHGVAKSWTRLSDFTSLLLSLVVTQMVNDLPAVWETQVRSLSWEDPLEKEMATHSSTLAWKIPWMEEPGRLQSTGSHTVQTRLSDFTLTFNFNLFHVKL